MNYLDKIFSDRRLSPYERLVLVVLAHQIGACQTPSQVQLGNMAGVTAKSISHITKRLEKKGWLTVTRQPGNKPCVYTIHWDCEVSYEIK